MKIFIGYENDGQTPKYTSDIKEVLRGLCHYPLFTDHEGVRWLLPQDSAATVEHMCNLIAAQEAALNEVQKCHWWWPFGAIRKARKILSECEEAK